MAQNDKLLSINNCVQIDLFGQVCAESYGIRHITGTGGQLDFLTGSYMSKGGKGYICLSSTYVDQKTGKLASRIVPNLFAGGIVTDPRSQAFYVVTEYGKVNLAGNSSWEMAEKLISIAHPSFRDELIKSADEMKIFRRSKG
jgi:acyl-CoA hydrolase